MTCVESASWCRAQHALPCCRSTASRLKMSTTISTGRKLYVWNAKSVAAAHDALNYIRALALVRSSLELQHSPPQTCPERKKGQAHSMVCDSCSKGAAAREQRLRQLMEKSKRAACTCKTQLAHSEMCPLHMRFAGERPYPGCDVMPRDDSVWLEQRSKKQICRST